MVPLITAFTLVLVAELGDKTQLATIMLSSKASSRSVFTGAMLAFFLVDGVSVLLGGRLLDFLPYKWVGLASGLVFISFGLLSLLRNARSVIEIQKASFLKTFSTIFLMELGDKTQLASIALAAEFKSPVIVLVGVMLAFSVVTGTGVLFGSKLLRQLPERYLKTGTALLFIFFGAVFIFNAITIVPSI